MDYRIFIMHTDVNACDLTWGCTDTERVCTEGWLWEENPLLHQGNRTCISNMRVWRSNQLSHIPSPSHGLVLEWFIVDKQLQCVVKNFVVMVMIESSLGSHGDDGVKLR